MKDHEGFLSKGWMMHEPYSLHNGTPALAIYTYLYRTTRKNEWQGTLQTLASIVEIPLRTIRANLNTLQSRGLITIKPLAYSHYSIKAQRLTSKDPEVGISGQVVGINGTEVGINGTEVGINGAPIKDNININKNININHSGGGVKETSSPTTATAPIGFSRLEYIVKVLAHSIPEHPFREVYEYAGLVNIPKPIVDSFVLHYEAAGWKMKNGGRISNWAAALRNWQKREERFVAQQSAKSQATKAIVSYQAGQQMRDCDRIIFEQEKQRKEDEKTRRNEEDKNAITYAEYLALKQKNQV